MPRLCEFYPGICLTTEEKSRKNLNQGKKNLSQVKKNLSQSTVYIYQNTHTLQNPHKTHTLQNPYIHAHTHTHTHTQRKGFVQTKGPRRVTKRKKETTESSIAGRKEAEAFLRGQSEIPLKFMEFVEDRLPHLQEPTAGPCLKPGEHTQPPSCLIKVYCNTIFPPTQGFSKWSLSSRCCYQNSVYVSLLIALPHVPRISFTFI